MGDKALQRIKREHGDVVVVFTAPTATEHYQRVPSHDSIVTPATARRGTSDPPCEVHPHVGHPCARHRGPHQSPRVLHRAVVILCRPVAATEHDCKVGPCMGCQRVKPPGNWGVPRGTARQPHGILTAPRGPLRQQKVHISQLLHSIMSSVHHKHWGRPALARHIHGQGTRCVTSAWSRHRPLAPEFAPDDVVRGRGGGHRGPFPPSWR